MMKKYDDWRLPTREELLSLVDDTRDNPVIDTTFFPDTQTSPHWSGTPCIDHPAYAWVVYFGYGFVYGYSKGYDACVRAVRGGRDTWELKAVPRYTDNGDGTVTDNRTGLMWQQQTLGSCSWDEANKIIEKVKKDNL